MNTMQSCRPFQHAGIGLRARPFAFARRTLTCASPGLMASRRILRQWNSLHQFKNINANSGATNQSSQLSQLGMSVSMGPQRARGDGRGRPSVGGARKAALVWFRGDLRLHDHEALAKANSECTSLLPVYCFDPRDYQKSPQGYDRTGPYRAQFLVEAVADLRARLRRAGSELVVRCGRPEEVLAGVARSVGAAAVYCHGEVTYEGRQVEARVKAAVEGEGAQLSTWWTNTLHHPQDLPFRLQDLPQHFDQFQKRLSGVAARAALGAPQQLRGPPAGVRVDPGEIPTLKQLGLTPAPQSSADAKPTGGETEALRQLQAFLAHARGGGGSPGSPSSGTGAGSAAAIKWGPTAACGGTFANNIAPWLAAGCLSPRHMHDEARRVLGAGAGAPVVQAQAQGARGGCAAGPMAWVNFELLWRDFFRFITLRYTEAGMSSSKAAAMAPAAPPALAAL